MMTKKLFATAALLLASATAFATPQYAGETVSADLSDTMTEAGYYLWQDDVDASEWHLRWTGIGADHDPVQWAGSFQFRNTSLDTVTEVLFETTGAYADTSVTYYDTGIAGEDAFQWTAATNATGGYDGIDFTITSNLELMTVGLGSSLFDDLTIVNDDPGVASVGIYIGADKQGTNVLISERGDGVNKMMFQNFEVKVPEPNSIALLGLGLACLGIARRRQRKA